MYELVLALVISNQCSVIIKTVKDIIEKADFIQKLKDLQTASKELHSAQYKYYNKALLMFKMESLYGSLPNYLSYPNSQQFTRYISNELAHILIDNKLIETLVAFLVGFYHNLIGGVL